MRTPLSLCCLLLLFFSGCRDYQPGLADIPETATATGAALSSIAGAYTLTSVGGAALPCCGTDSAGTSITLVSGSLALDSLAADVMVFVPSGVTTARSCVHEIPNGAIVDTAGVVRMPDGSTYQIPKCGAPYTLRLAYRYVAPDGRPRTVERSKVGRYVWGGNQLRVFEAPMGSDGRVSVATNEIQLRLAPLASSGPFSEPPGPEYRFIQPRN